MILGAEAFVIERSARSNWGLETEKVSPAANSSPVITKKLIRRIFSVLAISTKYWIINVENCIKMISNCTFGLIGAWLEINNILFLNH